ncbi:MAG: hypothetical protein ACRDPM_16885, partial [Solirubrobacteraceae bacterium]
MLGELAILRRPQRSSDLDSTVLKHALRPFGNGDSLDRALIRRATTASGQHVFLIPVEHSSSAGPGSPGLLIVGAGGAGAVPARQALPAGQVWSTSGPPNRLLLIVPM